jgi:hypothetical protein
MSLRPKKAYGLDRTPSLILEPYTIDEIQRCTVGPKWFYGFVQVHNKAILSVIHAPCGYTAAEDYLIDKRYFNRLKKEDPGFFAAADTYESIRTAAFAEAVEMTVFKHKYLKPKGGRNHGGEGR